MDRYPDFLPSNAELGYYVRLHLLAMMGAQGVGYHSDRCDRRRDRLVEILEEHAKFCLALSQVTCPIYRANAGVKGGKEMESAVAAIRVFEVIGFLVGLGG